MPDNTATCENCGFNIEEHKLYEKYLKQPADPEVPEDQKSSLVDNPVLTLLSGGLSVFFSLLFISASTIVILYLALFILFVFFTFYLSSKPSVIHLVCFLHLLSFLQAQQGKTPAFTQRGRRICLLRLGACDL